MWIAFNNENGTGFVSIVAKDRDEDPSMAGPAGELSLRFRRQADAYKLLGEDADVIHTPEGDYAYRVFITRAALAEVLVRLAVGLDYTNFKASTPTADLDMLNVLHDAWDAFGELQEGGPYGVQSSMAFWGDGTPPQK